MPDRPKPKRADPVKMWAIRNPRGDLVVPSWMGISREECLLRFSAGHTSAFNWRADYRKGWRCVRVEVKEVRR